MAMKSRYGQSSVLTFFTAKPKKDGYFSGLKRYPERKKNSGIWKEKI